MMTQVWTIAPPGMVTVCMGNNSFVDGLPGVNIKISFPAKQTFMGEFNKGHRKRPGLFRSGLDKSFSVPELNEMMEVAIIQNMPVQLTIVFNDGIKYLKKKV